MIDTVDKVTGGMKWVTYWWGYELHFNHDSMQALIEADILNILSIVVGKVVPPPAGTGISAIIWLQWEIMKRIDEDTGTGVKLCAPWCSPMMLIPAPRTGSLAGRLCWLVYGNPQETFDLSGFHLSNGEQKYSFADQGKQIVLDDAGGAWGQPELFPGHSSQSGAALADYNGTLYCINHGGSDNYLWYSTYDGKKNWNQALQFPASAKTKTNPALAVYQDRLHCVFVGTDDAL